MSILRVISENVKVKYSRNGDSPTRGYFELDGKWYHWYVDSGAHFMEGQEVDGNIIEVERTDYFDKNRRKYNVIVFNPDKKYSPPRYSYEFFENRNINFDVLGYFQSDCKLCGEKSVVEYTHVLGDCPKKYSKKVEKIQKAKEEYFNQFKTNL